MSVNQQRKPAFDYRSGVLIGILVLLAVLVLGMATGRCTGSVGPAGPIGPGGPSGPQGPNGDVTTARGPQGDKGDNGAAGPEGGIGPAGAAGPAGGPGPVGPAGPETPGVPGEIGPTGPAGVQGTQGVAGVKGDLAFIHPPLNIITDPSQSFDLLFDPVGIEIVDPVEAGTPLDDKRHRLDLSTHQAVRLQFAHKANNAIVKISVQYFADHTGAWHDLIPPTGAGVAANENQSSNWRGTPRFFTDVNHVLVRPVVHGDGEVDPLITYIRLDVR